MVLAPAPTPTVTVPQLSAPSDSPNGPTTMNSEIPDLPFSPITAQESPNATPDVRSDLPAEVPDLSSESPEPIAGPASAPSDDRPVLDWQLVPGSRSQRVFRRYRRTEVRCIQFWP